MSAGMVGLNIASTGMAQGQAAEQKAAKAELAGLLGPRPATEEPGGGVTGGVSAPPSDNQIGATITRIDPVAGANFISQARDRDVTIRGQDKQAESAAASRSLREMLAERGFTESRELASLERDFMASLAADEADLKRSLSADERAFKREQFALNAALQKELKELDVLNDKETPGQFLTRMVNKNIEKPGTLTEAERQGVQVLMREDPLRAARAARLGNNPDFQPGKAGAESTTPKPLPEGISEEDIKHTMEKHNLTREEVLRRMGAR